MFQTAFAMNDLARAARSSRGLFLAEGVDGLLRDATRPPGKKPIAEDRVKAPVDLAMSPPPEHARHWTVRALARPRSTSG